MSPAAVEAILQDFAHRATRLGAVRPDGSELWRFEVDGHAYDLHYYPDDDTLVRRRLGGADAAREFTQLQALQKLGVPATRVIANLKGFRIGERKGDACIVVHDPKLVPLATLAPTWACVDYPERTRLIAGLIQRLEELHRHRMVPRWPGKSRLGTALFGRRGDGTVAIIDGTRRMNTRVAPADLIAMDLATQFCTTRADRVRFWRHFTDEKWDWAKAVARRMRAGGVAADALSGTSDDFGSVEHDGWTGRYVRRLPIAIPWSNANDLNMDADGWRAVLPTLLDPKAAGWTALKHDAAAQVYEGRITLPDTAEQGRRELSVVVKRPATPGGFGGRVKRLRASRVERAWVKTWRALGLGFACEVPLLLLERRTGPMWSEQLVVFERVPGPTMAQVPLDELSTAHRAQLLGECGRTMGRLERAGYGHQDAKNTNWIAWTDAAGRPRPVLIDCDGLRRFVPKGRAMPRFIRSMRLKPEFTDVDLAAIEAGFVRGRSSSAGLG